MELLEKLLPPLVVAIFMFVMNRNQKKRDDLLANEQKHKDSLEGIHYRREREMHAENHLL